MERRGNRELGVKLNDRIERKCMRTFPKMWIISVELVGRIKGKKCENKTANLKAQSVYVISAGGV